MIDTVPAAAKPTGGVKFHVNNNSDGKLVVDASSNNDDTLMEITDSSGSSVTIETSDSTATGSDITGSGVHYLTLRTNDVIADHHRGDTGSGDEGTDVIVPRLAGGQHLRVDTGSGTFDEIRLGDDNAILEDVIVKTGAGNDSVMIAKYGGDDGVSALVDFGSGSGNSLVVNGAGDATLGYIDRSSGAIVVDSVSVEGSGNYSAAGVLTVADPATIGEMEIYGLGSVTISAPTTIINCRLRDNTELSLEDETTIYDTLTEEDGATVFITAPADIDTFDQDGEAYIGAASTIDTLTVNGTVAFGTEGSVDATEDGAEIASTGELNYEVSSIAFGVGYATLTADALVVNSGATLSLTLVNDYLPMEGHLLAPIAWGTKTGGFTTFDLPGGHDYLEFPDNPGNFFEWDGRMVNLNLGVYDENDHALGLLPFCLRGDLDFNVSTDADDIPDFLEVLGGADFTEFQELHPTGFWFNGDLNLDGAVDADDIPDFLYVLGL